MPNYSLDLSRDLPSPIKRKRIVFYRAGLKVYGHIPYILNRKLKGQFCSNYYVNGSGPFRGHGVIAPTCEDNYTAIPYGQSSANAQALFDWLHEDAGFEWAIAGSQDYEANIFQDNIGQWPPVTWVPDMKPKEFIQRLLDGKSELP